MRALQAEGVPIVRVHPCGQYGPQDPYLNPSNAMIRDILRGLYPFWASGSLPWGDVRDSAATIVAVLDRPGDPGEAWLTPCHNLADDGLTQGLRALTGRRLPGVRAPRSYARDDHRLGPSCREGDARSRAAALAAGGLD